MGAHLTRFQGQPGPGTYGPVVRPRAATCAGDRAWHDNWNRTRQARAARSKARLQCHDIIRHCDIYKL